MIDADTSLLENIVASSLIRRYGREDAVFFYNKGIEVDFYIPEDELAIQVSFSIRDEETRKREVKALQAIGNVLPCKHRIIITYDENDEWQLSSHGIEVVPVWKWMLTPS